MNPNLTADAFENVLPHLLDLEINSNGGPVFHKDIQTGYYVHGDSYSKWIWKCANESLVPKRSSLQNYLANALEIFNDCAMNSFSNLTLGTSILS